MSKGITVIKVGTAILSKDSGRLDSARIASIVSQICALKKQGHRVVLVSSGAIGAGVEAIGLKIRPTNLNQLQACAAVGQGKLMKFYEQNFKKNGKHAAQILLTKEDFVSKKRVLMAKHTINSLLNDFNAVPIINENDTIAIDEIKFGDNDKLSARVAKFVGAHTLIILSDVDGLYNPKTNKVINIVKKIGADIKKMAQPSKSRLGRGGMVTKIEAAKMVTTSGIKCIIANGRTKDVLLRLSKEKALGTRFLPSKKKVRK